MVARTKNLANPKKYAKRVSDYEAKLLWKGDFLVFGFKILEGLEIDFRFNLICWRAFFHCPSDLYFKATHPSLVAQAFHSEKLHLSSRVENMG